MTTTTINYKYSVGDIVTFKTSPAHGCKVGRIESMGTRPEHMLRDLENFYKVAVFGDKTWQNVDEEDIIKSGEITWKD